MNITKSTNRNQLWEDGAKVLSLDFTSKTIFKMSNNKMYKQQARSKKQKEHLLLLNSHMHHYHMDANKAGLLSRQATSLLHLHGAAKIITS